MYVIYNFSLMMLTSRSSAKCFDIAVKRFLRDIVRKQTDNVIVYITIYCIQNIIIICMFKIINKTTTVYYCFVYTNIIKKLSKYVQYSNFLQNTEEKRVES